jgi:hypothetical protein
MFSPTLVKRNLMGSDMNGVGRMGLTLLEVTERLGPVVNMPTSYSGGPGLKYGPHDRLS